MTTITRQPPEEKVRPIIELGEPNVRNEKLHTRLVFKLMPTGDTKKDVNTFVEAMDRYEENKLRTIILFTTKQLYDELLRREHLKSDGGIVKFGEVQVLKVLIEFGDSMRVKDAEQNLRDLVDDLSYGDGGGIPRKFNVIEVHDGIEVQCGMY